MGTRSLRTLLAVMLIAAPAGDAVAQSRPSVGGVVRDTSGAGLPGAAVALGARTATTGSDGAFLFRDVAPGRTTLVVRLPGYRPHRTQVAVPDTGHTDLDIFLTDAPVLLPEIVVRSTRTGIHGTVGDTGFRAAPGATVEILGFGGATLLTDSAGRFSRPQANQGVYLVRVSLFGYADRRILVEIEKGKGAELAVLLTPSPVTRSSRIESVALSDLDRRLAWNRRETMLTAADLERYGSRSLCDVPRIRSVVGDAPTVLVNGVTILREYPICGWQVDEIAMVEFGREVCADVTGTIAATLGNYCSGRTTSVSGSQRSITGAGTVGRGGSYVVIWEKR